MLLQGGGFRFNRLQQTGNVANLCPHADFGHHKGATATGDGGAVIDHVAPIAEGLFLGKSGGGLLIYWG